MAKEQEPENQPQKNQKESQKNPLEHPAFKEEWTVNFDTLDIAGETATGKSTAADLLGLAYNVQVFKVGEEIRKRGEKRADGTIHRDIALDLEFDEKQRDIISNPGKSYIIEGRMSAVIATEEKKKNPNLRVIRIKFQTSPETAYERLAARENISIEEAKSQLENRRGSDLPRWRSIHPILGEDGTPYDLRFFDYIADASKPLFDVFNDIHEYLLSIKAIEPKYKNDQPAESGQIFPTPNL